MKRKRDGERERELDREGGMRNRQAHTDIAQKHRQIDGVKQNGGKKGESRICLKFLRTKAHKPGGLKGKLLLFRRN